MSVKSLITQIQAYNPEAEIGLLERCYRFAQEAHKGAKTKIRRTLFFPLCRNR